MDDLVPRWVRIGVVVTLAVPQVLTGLWAVVAPHSWWDRFPGIGPALVSASPPFNEHLVSDVGAGFLATGVALAVAGITGRRPHIGLALLTYLVFTVPHVVRHATHEAPGLGGAEEAYNVALLLSGVVLAVVFAAGARRGAARPGPVPMDERVVRVTAASEHRA